MGARDTKRRAGNKRTSRDRAVPVCWVLVSCPEECKCAKGCTASSASWALLGPPVLQLKKGCLAAGLGGDKSRVFGAGRAALRVGSVLWRQLKLGVKGV